MHTKIHFVFKIVHILQLKLTVINDDLVELEEYGKHAVDFDRDLNYKYEQAIETAYC